MKTKIVKFVDFRQKNKYACATMTHRKSMSDKQQALTRGKICLNILWFQKDKGGVSYQRKLAIFICKICCREYAFKAKKYLAIPASSIPSEQVFSLTDNLVNKMRARLSPSNIDNMISRIKTQNTVLLKILITVHSVVGTRLQQRIDVGFVRVIGSGLRNGSLLETAIHLRKDGL